MRTETKNLTDRELVRPAATDSQRLRLAKALAREARAQFGRARSEWAFANVRNIIEEGEPSRVIKKKKSNLPNAAAAISTRVVDRPEYIDVREELKEIISRSPERPTHDDAQLFAHCREKFGVGVTERLFNEAKSAAVAAFSGEADAWIRGGRPTKTVAPRKPSHP